MAGQPFTKQQWHSIIAGFVVAIVALFIVMPGRFADERQPVGDDARLGAVAVQIRGLTATNQLAEIRKIGKGWAGDFKPLDAAAVRQVVKPPHYGPLLDRVSGTGRRIPRA